MKTLIFSIQFPFVLLALLSFRQGSCMASNGQNDLIDDTCRGTPYYQLCTVTLRSNPTSNNADVARLALNIVQATKDKTTDALNSIKRLGNSWRLRACSKAYNFILAIDIPLAVEAVSKGDPKFGQDGMRDSTGQADKCKGSLGQTRSPITPMNNEIHDLSVIAVSIIQSLL